MLLGVELLDSRQVVNRRSFGEPRAGRWLSCVGTVIVGLALSGCGWLEGERVSDDTANLEQRIASARTANQEGAGFASVRVSGRPYLGIEIEELAEARLPEDLRADDGVTLPLGDGPSAEAIAERIEEAAGVAVRFVGTASSGEGEEGKSVGCAGSRAEWLASLGDELSGNGGVWSGSLEGFLGRWTSAEGFDWRYDAANEAIQVVRSATRIFGINALLGKQEYTASTSTSGVAGEGTTATALQSLSSTLSYDPWEEIKAQVEGAAGAEATAVVSPAAGTVTVTGCPQGIERVRQYLDHLNREVLRPIILSVHMYSVKFDRASDFELGVSGFLPKVFGSNFVVGFEGGNVSVVSPSVGSRSSLQATVNAIRSVGSAQRVTSIDIPSLNGRPTQFYDLYDHGYLKEVQTVVEEGVTRISLTPGTVWSGFGVSYVGRIVAPDEILARITATIQDAPSFTVFGPADNQIQLPSAGRRAIVVEQRIGRGETLLLTGFSNRESSESRGGSIFPVIPFPEGERRSLVDRTETVLLVTAEVGEPMGIREFRGSRGQASYRAVNDDEAPARAARPPQEERS